MEIVTTDKEIIQSLVLNGDLGKMSPEQKVQYYKMFCDRLGLDPLTQPFKLLMLQGKEILYCDRSGAQQLNKLHKISHEIKSRDLIEAAGVYQVTARATGQDGRYTDSIGAVNISGLKGDAYANAIMKAETKAKRRATLDLLGLGMLDETETETIPNASASTILPEPIINDVDELHAEYISLYNEYTIFSNDPDARKLHPDNWKKEPNAENYRKAIEAIKARLNGLPGYTNGSAK
jgi:hypothetical protein